MHPLEVWTVIELVTAVHPDVGSKSCQSDGTNVERVCPTMLKRSRWYMEKAQPYSLSYRESLVDWVLDMI